MPKSDRFNDTVTFLRGVPLGGDVVAAKLDAYQGMIPPSVDDAMHMGRGGDETDRKRRRAIVLITCILMGAKANEAQQMAQNMAAGQLQGTLTGLLQNLLIADGGPQFRPMISALKLHPRNFLSNNRIKLRGARASASTSYDFYYDPHKSLYAFDPSSGTQMMPYAVTRAFNVHVQKFADVKDNITTISGATATEDIVVTTQLSGCSVLYRVSGPKLECAHIQPDGDVKKDLPDNLKKFAGWSTGSLLTKRLETGGSLGGIGGTLGVYGCVETEDEQAKRVVMRNIKGGTDAAMRVHGYCRKNGAGLATQAYFIAIRQGADWKIFGQRNRSMDSTAGIESLTRLYPLE